MSCTSNVEDNTEEVLAFLNTNKLTITDTLSGVLVCVVKEGSIDKPKIDTTRSVTFIVQGQYLDGIIFDENSSETQTTVNMSVMLDGLRIGITKFGRGGSGTIIVPPSLGFGGNPPRGVRPDATLAFKVEVVDFQ